MDAKLIESLGIFKNIEAHKFTEKYDERISNYDYLKHFESEASNYFKSNNEIVILHLAITKHDENGNYFYDNYGNKIWDAIYIKDYLNK